MRSAFKRVREAAAEDDDHTLESSDDSTQVQAGSPKRARAMVMDTWSLTRASWIVGAQVWIDLNCHRAEDARLDMMVCALLNSAVWYWKDSGAGGLLRACMANDEDGESTDVRLLVDATFPECVHADFPMKWMYKHMNTGYDDTVAQLSADVATESWEEHRRHSKVLLAGSPDLGECIQVVMYSCSSAPAIARRVSLNAFLKTVVAWVRDAHRPEDALTSTDTMSAMLSSAKAERRVVYKRNTRAAYAEQFRDRSDITLSDLPLARLLPARQCRIMGEDTEGVCVTIQSAGVSCRTCKRHADKCTHDGMLTYDIDALHTLLQTREKLSVRRSEDSTRVVVRARPLLSSPEMLTLVLCPSRYWAFQGCITACWVCSRERTRTWKQEVVPKIRDALLHMEYAASPLAEDVASNMQVVANLVRACRELAQSGDEEASRLQKRKALEVSCYLSATIITVTELLAGGGGAGRAWEVKAASVGAGRAFGALEVVDARAVELHGMLEPAEVRVRVEEAAVPCSPMQPPYPLCLRQGDVETLQSIFDRVFERALNPVCPVCNTHVWLEDGCTAIMCDACGCRSCFVCGKPHVASHARWPDLGAHAWTLEQSLAFAATYAVDFRPLRDLITYATQAVTLDTLARLATCSQGQQQGAQGQQEDDDEDEAALRQETECVPERWVRRIVRKEVMRDLLDVLETAGIEEDRPVSRDPACIANVAAVAVAERAPAQLSLPDQAIGHADQRCLLYFPDGSDGDDDGIPAWHISHSRFSSMHAQLGDGDARRGRILVLRLVRQLSEAISMLTFNGCAREEFCKRVDDAMERLASRGDGDGDAAPTDAAGRLFRAIRSQDGLNLMLSLQNPNPKHLIIDSGIGGWAVSCVDPMFIE